MSTVMYISLLAVSILAPHIDKTAANIVGCVLLTANVVILAVQAVAWIVS